MKRLTIGVAGHVDHGKTALVGALTGIDTDRLAEEKARGMSIALGFAHLSTSEGEIDLIDVPGHERFLKTMISGATGIDALLLVIEAGEMVRPQTVEHLELAGLLGIRQGIVAITKSDLAPPEDQELRDLITEEVRGFLHGSFLAGFPLVWTSSHTGEGIADLVSALRALFSSTDTRSPQPCFYLPIDRVFTLPGQGTVVTGTLRRGALRTGDRVEIAPGGTRAEVRGLQVHGRAVERIEPGGRAAVNLRGIRKEAIQRGDALASPGFLLPTRLFDAEITLLNRAPGPLKRGREARLHFGTTETLARIYPLDRDEIAPGETAPVQVRLSASSEAVALPLLEHFIVRINSPGVTIGGGIVADDHPPKRTRAASPDATAEAARRISALIHGDAAARVEALLWNTAFAGRPTEPLAFALGLTAERLRHALAANAATPVAVEIGGALLLHASFLAEIEARILTDIERYHQQHSARPGIGKDELRARLPSELPTPAFHRVLEDLRRAGKIETDENIVRRAGFISAAALSPADKAMAREIAVAFQSGGLQPPDVETVLRGDSHRQELFRHLVHVRILIAATDRVHGHTVVFHREAVAGAIRTLREALASGNGLTAGEINTLLGTTRKFGIPLQERLDAAGITRRASDKRFLCENQTVQNAP